MVKDKHRGGPTYFNVLAELVRAAQYRGLTTYQDIAVMMGLPIRGSHMGSETGRILGEISEDEVTAGRPMLSVVAVSVEGKAGPGFFALARELGRLTGSETGAAFWAREAETGRRETGSVAWYKSLRQSSPTCVEARRRASTPRAQRVRLTIEPVDVGQDSDRAAALNRLRAGIASMSFSSSGPPPSRDELHVLRSTPNDTDRQFSFHSQ